MAIEFALLTRGLRVPPSVSLLVRRKSILRIRLQFDKLVEAAVRDGSSPSVDPEVRSHFVLTFLQLVKCLSIGPIYLPMESLLRPVMLPVSIESVRGIDSFFYLSIAVRRP